MADKKNRENGDVKRTGEEAEIQTELKNSDKMSGEHIKDRPYSKDRKERRRGQFIDLHGDEDGDEQTTEASCRKHHRGQDSSVDSTPSTSSTSST
jgi:hypothetical protein